ncbi:MAG: hypothetical protein ACLVB4_07930 [Butyricicoccus sp.]
MSVTFPMGTRSCTISWIITRLLTCAGDVCNNPAVIAENDNVVH